MSEIGLLVIAVLGLVLAAAMAGVAWHLRRDERRRSAARVATLAADIREAESFRAAAVAGRRSEPRIQPVATRKFEPDSAARRLAVSVDSTPELFRFGHSRGSQSRLAPVLGIGICALVVVLALILAMGRAAQPAAKSGALAPVARPVSGLVPVELVALGQDRDGDRMSVRGTVRNPASGERFDRLVAVVTFFDRDGKVLGSGRTPVQPSTLAPGAESVFAVTIAHAQNIGRYRVRFHVDERIVAHVDRRSGNLEVPPKLQ